MRYLSIFKGEDDVQELSKERTRELLSRCYFEEAVNDWIDNNKEFRINTMTRVIWTENDDGVAPADGFYGVAE